jgi:NADPH:quinone reductase-like Zn-dependent oxidoreductase
MGTDVAGIVQTAALDGSGPAVGQRVLGLTPARDAWAELVAVPTDSLAILPEGVPFEQAAALPGAGLTALYALRIGGLLLGERVLVTGASGGVGHLAVQLANQAGAVVVALVRREANVGILRAAGAAAVVVDETGAAIVDHGPYHLALDSVGGPVLTAALDALGQGGVCVHFGAQASRSATFNSGNFFRTGPRMLYGFYLFAELASQPGHGGLRVLADLVAAGRLKPLISIDASWAQIGKVAEELLERSFAGKAVLRVD